MQALLEAGGTICKPKRRCQGLFPEKMTLARAKMQVDEPLRDRIFLEDQQSSGAATRTRSSAACSRFRQAQASGLDGEV